MIRNFLFERDERMDATDVVGEEIRKNKKRKHLHLQVKTIGVVVVVCVIFVFLLFIINVAE